MAPVLAHKHPSHHRCILGQPGNSRCIRQQIPSGKLPRLSLPPVRPGSLVEGQRPRVWLRGQVCCFWFRTHFTPRAPVASPGTMRPQRVWLRCWGRRWWTGVSSYPPCAPGNAGSCIQEGAWKASCGADVSFPLSARGRGGPPGVGSGSLMLPHVDPQVWL